MMVDLQVEETPWTTIVEDPGILGYQVEFTVSVISSTIVLFQYKAPTAHGSTTYMEQAGQLPRLDIPTRPLCAQ